MRTPFRFLNSVAPTNPAPPIMTPPITSNRVVRGTWFPKRSTLEIGGASVDADVFDVVVGVNTVVEVGELVVVVELSELDITVEVSELDVGR